MSDEQRTVKAPRAVRLGIAETEERSLPVHVDVVPEVEPIDPEEAVVPAPVRRGFGWGSLFVAALSTLVTLAAGVWVERTVSALMAQSVVLGWAALVAAALALLALLVMIGRVARDILRETMVEALRERAMAALASNDVEAAKAIAAELTTLYGARAETAAGRAALASALPQLFAARDVLAVAERELLGPLDAEAQALVAQAARRVSLVTAVSPRALIDVGFVLVACARLLGALAGTASGRPGTLGLLRLARQVMAHLVVTGGIAAGDELVHQLVGQGLAARLSAKLGEGVLNGFLTARVGLAALAVCRPLPFVEARSPALSDVAGDLASSARG